VLDYELGPKGWFFSGRLGTDKEDPLYGFRFIRELYEKADPGYEGRFTVPCLWDRKGETVVNNESSEILVCRHLSFYSGGHHPFSKCFFEREMSWE
jgi:putative glutathione S-transferase